MPIYEWDLQEIRCYALSMWQESTFRKKNLEDV